MTSEAPQDVAALPQTEAGKRLLNWSAYDGVARLEEILEIEREAAAGLLDQNDRLRSALRDLLWWHEWMQREDRFVADIADTEEEAHRRFALWDAFMDHSSTVTWLRALLRGSGAEEAARNG